MQSSDIDTTRQPEAAACAERRRLRSRVNQLMRAEAAVHLSVDALSPVDRLAVERAIELERFGYPQPRRQLTVLQLHADPLSQFRPVLEGVESEHPDRSLIRRPKPFNAFDGRRLSRSVGPEDSEDLAFLHLKRNIVGRNGAAVTLAQVLNVNYC